MSTTNLFCYCCQKKEAMEQQERQETKAKANIEAKEKVARAIPQVAEEERERKW